MRLSARRQRDAANPSTVTSRKRMTTIVSSTTLMPSMAQRP
jgi:hypothetical protein